MNRCTSMTILRWLLPTVFSLAVMGCGQQRAVALPWDRPVRPDGVTLTDLHDVSDLQTVFNQDAGKPRLIMLVSPT